MYDYKLQGDDCIEKFIELKNNKTAKIMLLILVIVLSILYLKAFFTMGAYYDGAFLKREITSNETQYRGKSNEGPINITVIGKAVYLEKGHTEVIYNLPNNINKKYTVYYNHVEQWHLGAVEIKDENDSTIFEGRYNKGNMFLYDRNNKPITNVLIFTHSDKEEIYNENYEVSFKNIVEFSLHEKDEIRGDLGMLLTAVFLLTVTIIDIKYPLFFFTLSHFLEVKDPEPSEFYTSMQIISWVVYPIIALVLLVTAI